MECDAGPATAKERITIVNTKLSVESIIQNMANPQPPGPVRIAAMKMYLEEPFVSVSVIAEILGVSMNRVNQCIAGLSKKRAAAKKREIARLKTQYFQK